SAGRGSFASRLQRAYVVPRSGRSPARLRTQSATHCLTVRLRLAGGAGAFRSLSAMRFFTSAILVPDRPAAAHLLMTCPDPDLYRGRPSYHAEQAPSDCFPRPPTPRRARRPPPPPP